MERAEFKFTQMDQNDNKDELIKSLKGNQSVRYVIERDNIPEKELAIHTYTFKRFSEELSLCIGCKGLNHCKQKAHGYHMGLMYDGILQETLEPCKYQSFKENQIKHIEKYIVNDLPESFYGVSFDGINLSVEERSYGNAVGDVASACMSDEGAYLYGPMGSGKTYLAACASNYVARNNGNVAFIHYPTFTSRLAELYRTGEYRKEVERCKFAKILVIDDIGAEEVTERNRSILLSILDVRMQCGRMTWFTSNQDFKALKAHFLTTSFGDDRLQADRIMERIQSLSKPIFINHEDRRNLYQTND